MSNEADKSPVDISDITADLSPEEWDVVMKILNEVSDTGQSPTLNGVWGADYEEIPVDIRTFITDPQYLGETFVDEDGNVLMYDYWIDYLEKLFAPGSGKFECLSGDTEVKLLDGSVATMSEIHERVLRNENIDIYSYDRKSERIVPSRIVRSKIMGTRDIYRIRFDNGEYVDCTSNHRILMRDNTYSSIDTGLTVGDSVMPFNTYINEKGYEILNHPKSDGSYTSESTYKMVASYKYGNDVAYSRHIHHANYIKSDNRPANLVAMTRKDHLALHCRRIHATQSDPILGAKLRQSRRESMIRRWNDESERKKFIEASRINMSKMWKINYDSMLYASHKWMKDEPERARSVAVNNLSKYNDALKRGEDWAVLKHKRLSRRGALSRWSNESQRKEASKRLSERNRSADYKLKCKRGKSLKVVSKLLAEGVEVTRESYNSTKPRMATNWDNLFPEIFVSEEELLDLSRNYNHKVTSIEYLRTDLVYDIEVPTYHNFCLASGIIVHNCALSGAIGLGKSTIACAGMAYIIHRLLCLKNPAKYYKLTKGSRIGIALFNISLSASYGVGYNKLQSMLKLSPWFLERGELRGLKDKTYYPGKNIDIVVGSKMEHFIGRDIFCMTGDTLIKTEKGYEKLEDLAGTSVRVYSQSRYNQILTLNECEVALTKYVDEIYEITLEDGTVLKCTGDHKLMMSNGMYKRVMDMTTDDELMDSMFGYIYKTTDTVTGKIYIGAKSSYKFLPNYYGSGKNIKAILKERGQSHGLTVELLDICYHPSELIEKELYYIDKYDSCNPNIGLNILHGGQTRPPSLTARHRLSKSAQLKPKRSLESRLKQSESLRGSNNPMYGKSAISSKVCVSKNDHFKYVYPDEVPDYESRGYVIGKPSKVGYNIGKGRSKYIYQYNGIEFYGDRKLREYLLNNGYPTISTSTIRKLCSNKSVKGYEDLLISRRLVGGDD